MSYEVIRWCLVVPAGLIWAGVSLLNGLRGYSQFVKGEDDGAPLTPLIGGVMGSAAVLVAPLGTLDQRLPWVLVPIALDFGALPYLVLCLFSVGDATWFVKRHAMKSDPHALNRFKETPLHSAAKLGITERCKQLLGLGADPTAKDKWGVTPLRRAEICQMDECVALLRGVVTADRSVGRAEATGGRAYQEELRRQFEFVSLGMGPKATGDPSGGWAVGQGHYFRCIRCDYLMSDNFTDYEQCFCGAMDVDVHYGRFGSNLGDMSIEVLKAVPKHSSG